MALLITSHRTISGEGFDGSLGVNTWSVDIYGRARSSKMSCSCRSLIHSGNNEETLPSFGTLWIRTRPIFVPIYRQLGRRAERTQCCLVAVSRNSTEAATFSFIHATQGFDDALLARGHNQQALTLSTKGTNRNDGSSECWCNMRSAKRMLRNNFTWL